MTTVRHLGEAPTIAAPARRYAFTSAHMYAQMLACTHVRVSMHASAQICSHKPTVAGAHKEACACLQAPMLAHAHIVNMHAHAQAYTQHSHRRADACAHALTIPDARDAEMLTMFIIIWICMVPTLSTRYSQCE